MANTIKLYKHLSELSVYLSDTQCFTPPNLSENATFSTYHRGLSHYRDPI